jgi:uncharacterized membrane protein
MNKGKNAGFVLFCALILDILCFSLAVLSYSVSIGFLIFIAIIAIPLSIAACFMWGTYRWNIIQEKREAKEGS